MWRQVFGLLLISGCTPSPASRDDPLGQPCAQQADCGLRLLCYDDVPGGMCSFACATSKDCGARGVCFVGRCWLACADDADCTRGAPWSCVGGHCGALTGPSEKDLGARDLVARTPDMAEGPDSSPVDLAVGPDLLGHCLDGVQDGDESDVDCGGSDCPPCRIGQRCIGPGDCRDPMFVVRFAFDCVKGICTCAGGNEPDGRGGCMCDPVHCGACCAGPEFGNLCFDPHSVLPNDYGDYCGPAGGDCASGACFLDQWCGPNCFPGRSGTMCFGGSDPLCCGCWSLDNPTCFAGDTDDHCGVPYQECVPCGQRQHCVAGACVGGAPDGGATDAAPGD